jgi:hypothetical protein
MQLLPENKIRLIISNNFQWQSNGPIERFFRTKVQQRFFEGAFNVSEDIYMGKTGRFIRAAKPAAPQTTLQ